MVFDVQNDIRKVVETYRNNGGRTDSITNHPFSQFDDLGFFLWGALHEAT